MIHSDEEVYLIADTQVGDLFGPAIGSDKTLVGVLINLDYNGNNFNYTAFYEKANAHGQIRWVRHHIEGHGR